MRRCIRFRWWVLGVLLLAPPKVAAQWPSDPAVDLFLADGPTEQLVPHVAATVDGGCYVGWYDSPGLGVFHVRLQRLSPSGEELWGHDGILISDHPTDTWVMDWDLIVDRDGNAVLGFTDLRYGEFDLHVYKIGPDGSFLWGDDGISLTQNEQIPGPPSLMEASDGDLVAVWPEGNQTMRIRMQRLSPAGALRLAEGGIEIAGEPGKFAYGARAIAAPGGDAIVAWIPDSDMDRPRHLAAARFDPNGAATWSDEVVVFDGGNIPMGSYFEMLPDGQGGVFLAWTAEHDLFFDVRVQRLDADGLECWGHDGVDAFVASSFEHIYPAIAYDPGAEALYVFARSQTPSQGNWGLDGQKLGLDGARGWGDAGVAFLPVDATWISIPLCGLAPGGGAVVAMLSHAPSSTGQERVLALRSDPSGACCWAGSTVEVASTLGDKLFLRSCAGADGATRLVWQDRRNDYGDIVAKSVNLDGSLGSGATAIPGAERGRDVALSIHPNPCNPRARIDFELERAQRVTVGVYDSRGRRVATLADRLFPAGPRDLVWQGRDASGRRLASGSYLIRLTGEDFETSRKVTLVR